MTDYNEQQRKAAIRQMVAQADNNIEAQRKRAIDALGERWVCHPKHAPKRARYNPMTGAYLGEAA
ncbi:hypothetical protein [Paraburkholderia caledonica]|uniref:Uncharacterized protein n=1 Tax=Paraburkholderia caledonica TaxID=134536 RepID=A0AB73IRR8_9BURK|nr:hypothetical protein [Paraburkholderia caledonica]